MACIIDHLVNFYPKDPTAFWTMILVGATLLLFIIAWIQLGKISKTGSADFIHRFKEDFFRPETRRLIMLIDQDCIKFKDDDLAGFEVIEDPILEQKGRKDPKNVLRAWKIFKSLLTRKTPSSDKTYYTGYELDDLVLGHFEDLGIFEKRGIIKIDMIYEEFGWYIEAVRDNCEIDKYIKSQRAGEPADKDIYDQFDYIYEKSKSFGQAKIHKKSIFLWKIKWWFCHRN